VVNKGDVSWMLVSSALVLLMSIPALALFYGGLVRAKNMLSVLMQVLMIVSVAGAGVGVLGLFDGLTASGALALRGGFSVP
jgi:Amt family ammonium transporter